MNKNPTPNPLPASDEGANPDFSPKSSNPYKISILGFHTASKINSVKNAQNRFSIRIR
jgi:hypothetical protein